MAFIGEIAAYLKADNSDYKSKLDEAGQATEKLDKSLKKFGLGFGGVALIATAFRAIVDHARDLKGELDENQARAKAFAQGLDEAKKSALDVGVSILGTINGLGEWMGRQAAIVAHGREQVELAEKIERETQETLKTHEKNRKTAEEIGRIRAQIVDEEKRNTNEANKQLEIKQRILIAEQKLQAAIDEVARAEGNKLETVKAELDVAKARGELQRVNAEAAKKAAEEEKKRAEDEKKAQADRVDLLKQKNQLSFEQLSTQEKIWFYEDSIAELTRLINVGKKEGADVLEYEVALMENNIELSRHRKDLEGATKLTLDDQITALKEQGMGREQMIAQLRQAGFAEDEILNKLREQTAELQIQFSVRGRRDSDLSDAVLEDKIRTLSTSLSARKSRSTMTPGGVGGIGDYDPFIFEEQKELDRAKNELDARRRAENLVGRYGEEGAARFYRGNMPEFERLLSLIDPDQAKKQTSLLEDLNNRLSNSGLFPKR
jgi:hypothetical protein